MTLAERSSTLRSLAQAAVAQADDAASATIRPDHPFLLVGPDLLVGVNGRLIAAFLPTNAEKTRRQDLHARVAITRLALQPATVAVLIDARRPVREELGWVFDEVVAPDDEERFARLCLGTVRRTTLVSVETRNRVARRYATIVSGEFDVSPDSLEEAPFSGEIESVAVSSGPPTKGTAGASGRFRRPSALSVLRREILSAVNADTRFIDGAPQFSRDEPPIRWSSLTEMPSGRSDLEKPVRSAAFAGIAADVSGLARWESNS